MSKTVLWVIVLCAIAAAIIVLARAKAMIQADLIGCESYLGRIKEGLTLYSAEHAGSYPATLDELVPKYLPHIPTCWASEKPYIYTVTDHCAKVSCHGPHPGLLPGSPFIEASPVATPPLVTPTPPR